mmetsp:Transcript_19012/g.34346  ORF Transcript_19012/g.34346 Transcript_19012/m.34346 type:complete len:1054 (+) Transcript_19012:274-3435(+)
MIVYIEVLQRYPLEVQAYTSFEDLCCLIVWKLRSAQGVSGVHPENIYLFFAGVIMSVQTGQAGVSLEELGLYNGASLYMISTEYAEWCRDRAYVRSVGAAFEEAYGGSASEVAVLDATKPFDMCCPYMELGELGAGWPLFFELLIVLMGLSAILLVCQLPSLLLFALQPSDAIDEWPAETSVSSYWLSAGNTGPDGSDSVLPALVTLVSCVAVWLTTLFTSMRQLAVKDLVNRTEVDPSDYAIFVEGLPPDATELGVRQFFEAHGCTDHVTEVVKVVLGYDVEELMEVNASIQMAWDRLLQAEVPPTNGNGWHDAQPQVMHWPQQTGLDAMQGLQGTGSAVVVLRWPSHRKRVLAEWDSPLEAILRMLHLSSRFSSLPRFQGSHVLSVTPAASPTDIIWENVGLETTERWKRRVVTHIVAALIFLACFLPAWGASQLEMGTERGTVGAFAVQAGLVLVQVLATIIMGTAARRLVDCERHDTRTHRDSALLWQLSVAVLLIYTTVELLAWNDAGQDWYKENGLLWQAILLEVINAFSLPFFIYFDFILAFQWLGRKFLDPAWAGAHGLRQSGYNWFFVPIEMDAPASLSYTMSTFIAGLVFMPMFPLGMAVTLLALFLQYWVFKYQLLRRSRWPYRQSHKLVATALRLLSLGTAAFAFAAWLFLSKSLKGAGEVMLNIVCWPCLAVSLLLTFLPSWTPLQQAFAASCCAFGLEVHLDAEEVDYYLAQRAWPKHQKYHTTHPAYLQLEAMAVLTVAYGREGAFLEWDPKTGNFPEPDVFTASGSQGFCVNVMDQGIGFVPTQVVHSRAEPSPARRILEDLKLNVSLSFLGIHQTQRDPGTSPSRMHRALARMCQSRTVIGCDSRESGVGGNEELAAEQQLPRSDYAAMPRRSPVDMVVGMQATVVELEGFAWKALNGSLCRLKAWSPHAPKPVDRFQLEAIATAEDAGKGSWLVEVPAGGRHWFSAANLRPLYRDGYFLPGQPVRLLQLQQQLGNQYEGTIATVLGWDADTSMWTVMLFTGVPATVAENSMQLLDQELAFSPQHERWPLCRGAKM